VTRYEHTQIAHVIIWSLLALILIVNGRLLGHHSPLLAASIILLVCLVLFYRLKITIDDETLCASFGPGIIRKRIRLADIVGCNPIRIHWWYGWGIHLTP
jgi:TRAP-type C4-dicarboxylate transport system permease large subunit